MIIFTWGEKKNASNKKKHGIDFTEASSAFSDEDALFKYDPKHSDEEDRFVLLGYTNTGKLVVVCHCSTDDEKIIRIFSARKAEKNEAKQYWEMNYAKRI